MHQWFAVKVVPQHEKNVASGFEARGIEHLLPLQMVRRRWSDRAKVLTQPVFPGYVLCFIGREARTPVLRTPGVREFVSFGSGPEPIPSDQITALRTLLTSGLAVEASAQLQPGQPVKVAFGPLRGAQGVLARVGSGSRFVVNLVLLQRSVSVEIEAGYLESAGCGALTMCN